MNTPPNGPPPPPSDPNNPYQQNPYGSGAPEQGQAPQPPQPGYGAPQVPQPTYGAAQAPQPGYEPANPYAGSQAPNYGGQSPYGGHPDYGQPQYGAPAPYETGEKKKGRGLLIGGGIAASLLLVGGGVFAATALLGSSGSHPYQVLPAESFAYGEIDFDPEADQKTAYLNMRDQLIDLFELDEDADLFETLAEPLGDHLDYTTEIEPWIGDRVGVALTGDAQSPDGFVGLIAYQIGDADKLGEVRSKFEVTSLVQGEYLIIASDERDEVLPESGFKNVLADKEGFTSDLGQVDGNTVASMWLDLGAAYELAKASGEDVGVDLDEVEVSGTVVAGLHLNSSYLQAQVKALDFSATGLNRDDFSLTSENVAALVSNMPSEVGVAVAIGGFDSYVNALLAEMEKNGEMADISDMIASGLRELRLDVDIFDPATITELLGEATGLSAVEEGVAFYADGGNEALISQVISALSETGMGDVSVSSEGSTVIVRSGSAGSGKLSDDPPFKNAMHNLDNAHVAVYVNPKTFDPYIGDVGVFGLTGSLDDKTAEFTLRWVLP